MLELMLYFHSRATRVIKHGATISEVRALPVIGTLIRMKTLVENDQLEKMDDIQKAIDDQMNKLDMEYK